MRAPVRPRRENPFAGVAPPSRRKGGEHSRYRRTAPTGWRDDRRAAVSAVRGDGAARPRGDLAATLLSQSERDRRGLPRTRPARTLRRGPRGEPRGRGGRLSRRPPPRPSGAPQGGGERRRRAPVATDAAATRTTPTGGWVRAHSSRGNAAARATRANTARQPRGRGTRRSRPPWGYIERTSACWAAVTADTSRGGHAVRAGGPSVHSTDGDRPGGPASGGEIGVASRVPFGRQPTGVVRIRV